MTPAELIIPRPISNRFSYFIPDGMKLEIGSRVLVEFGKQTILTGIVAQIGKGNPVKKILEVLGGNPVVYPSQIKLWAWVAEYYLCSEGEVMAAALPSGLRLSSESFLQANPTFESADSLSPKEVEVWQKILLQTQINYRQAVALAQEILGQVNSTLWGTEFKTGSEGMAGRLIRSLLEKEALLGYERVKEKYVPLKIKKVRLKAQYLNPESLNEAFSLLKKKPEAEMLLLRYLSLSKAHLDPKSNESGIEDHALAQNQESVKALRYLLKKGILESFEAIKHRFELLDETQPKAIELSQSQKEAFVKIVKLFETKQTVLFHGATGSGKTEIYIELADKVLHQGRQVLIMLPEIALTVQIVERFRVIFGSKLGVYHSKFSDRERVEIWQGVYSGKFEIVIGVRSSVFLPFNRLGLVVVDEEHDSSYKQNEPSPRYHARDTAIVLAQLQEAKVLLGSATPSLESWHNARSGRYGFVQLLERYSQSEPPEFVFADLKFMAKTKALRGDFSKLLLDEIVKIKADGKQSILFVNKRGYSPQILCVECGEIPQCANCSVSLTYHMDFNELRCHYCGYKQPLMPSCSQCHSTKLKTIGLGTEKVEDDLKLFVPAIKVVRMDLDTTRSKSAFERIIKEFASGATDVLTGTQMVTKGLDFSKVGLVGVMDADRMLNFPDFRSYERAFQLILQVAGRAGRRQERGKVVVQTRQPQHVVLQFIANQDYEGYYNYELGERLKFNYPPFSRLIVITIKSTNQSLCQKAAESLASKLREKLSPLTVMDAAIPLIEKINTFYQRTVSIKLPKNQNLLVYKVNIKALCRSFVSAKDFGKILVKIDVDAI